MNAIEPITPLRNRSAKRKYEHEALSVVEPLETVNTTFLFYLFSDDDHRSYAELYHEFNQRWIETIQNILKSRSFKYIGLDHKWFSNNYKPQT